MEITKITIENFKSIKKIDLKLEKIGDSYTKILLGKNESGKSNILEAISYFDEKNRPEGKVDYDYFCNDSNAGDVKITYDLVLPDPVDYLQYELDLDRSFSNYTLFDIQKHVCINKERNIFECRYTYEEPEEERLKTFCEKIGINNYEEHKEYVYGKYLTKVRDVIESLIKYRIGSKTKVLLRKTGDRLS